jgi:hypothetical protein
VGLWIAGGNANVIRNNNFYDNWRRGTMLFAVPDQFACGDSNDQVAGCDPTPGVANTSYRNQFYDNKMGQAPATKGKNGKKGKPAVSMPNGVDFWWDQGGIIVSASNSGNCWYSNTGRDGTAASVTGLPSPTGVPPNNLPSDCNNSPLPGGGAQAAELLACNGGPGNPTCPWFTTPPKP